MIDEGTVGFILLEEMDPAVPLLLYEYEKAS
jgi:hypothetical protein